MKTLFDTGIIQNKDSDSQLPPSDTPPPLDTNLFNEDEIEIIEEIIFPEP